MALTLNGSNNTIAGLAVGGLPDGIVDTDTLADGAATGPKQGAGSIIQVVEVQKVLQIMLMMIINLLIYMLI